MSIFTDPDHQLWNLIAQTRRAMHIARKKEMDKYDVSPRESALLLHVNDIGARATISELARLLYRERHSIAELVERMEKRGLVRKIKRSDGKKGTIVVLTDMGRQTHNKALKLEAMHEVLSCLSDMERQQLEACMQKLREKSILVAVKHQNDFIP